MTSDASPTATIVVIEKKYGRAYVKLAGSTLEPEQIEPALWSTIERWLFVYPGRVIDRADDVMLRGELVGIQVWYHDSEAAEEDDAAREIGVEIHPLLLECFSREYLEAVGSDAVRLLSSRATDGDFLLVVNPRRVAVVLSAQALRGSAVPVEMVDPILSAARRRSLETWLAAPDTSFFVTRVATNRDR